MPALLTRSGGLVRSLDGRSLVAGTPECLAACCGVPGFRRADPCSIGIGCGGGDEGAPIFVAIGARCTGGQPVQQGMTIGWNQACYIVAQDPIYRLCDGSGPPPGFGEECIPDGSEVIPPATAVPCVPDCQHPYCVPSQERWITLRPCNPADWPAGTPYPIVSADAIPIGCAVGSDADGRCWIVDCNALFIGPPQPEYNPPINLKEYHQSCCECRCGGGQYALLGCEEHFGFGGLNRCCCPFPLNPGTRMSWVIQSVTLGSVFGYLTRETTIEEGYAIVGGASEGTSRYRLEYLGSACPGFPNCPPSGCVEEITNPTYHEPQCPPPLWFGRPCPPSMGGPENVTWTGSLTCNRSVSRWVYTNPQPMPPCSFHTSSIVRTATFQLTGVNYAGCSGGCGAERLPPGESGDWQDLL